MVSRQYLAGIRPVLFGKLRPAPVQNAAISPNGTQIVTTARGGLYGDACVWTIDGGFLQRLGGPEISPLWDSTDKRLADGIAVKMVKGNLGLLGVRPIYAWDADKILEARISAGLSAARSIDSATFCSGDRVLTASRMGYFRLWDLHGKELAVLRLRERRSAITLHLGPYSKQRSGIGLVSG